MEYGIIVYAVTLVLIVFLVIAGVYFLIYQRHINKALKDPEGAKKSRIHLPSLGLSYTGMWFVVWIVSVVITLMMIMDSLSIARINQSYSESNAEMLNYLQEEVLKNRAELDEMYDEIRSGKYIHEDNTKFELGNFNAEDSTIELKVTVSDVNMSEGDTVKWRMNGRTVDLKQNLADKTFIGTIKMDIMEFDVDYTLDSVFISEVDGIKRVDRIFKYNRYYQDSDFGIDNENTYPSNYHFLPEGDFGEYWEDYFPAIDVTLMYDDGYDVSFEGNKLKIDEDVYFNLYKEVKVKDRKIVSGKVIVYINGKNVYAEKADINKIYDTTSDNQDYSIHIDKTFDNFDSNSTVDLMFEYEDNYGYSYSKRVWTQESPFDNTSKPDYTITDKNGKTIYSE